MDGCESCVKKLELRTSLAIQWLRICALQGAWVQFRIEELRSHKPHGAAKKLKKKKSKSLNFILQAMGSYCEFYSGE